MIWMGDDIGAGIVWAIPPDAGSISGIDWEQPLHLVCAEIEAALEAATGANWVFALSADLSQLSIDCSAGAWSLTISPEFRDYLGVDQRIWLTATTEDASPLSAELLVGHGLPVRVLPREVIGSLWPSVYGASAHWALDCQIIADYLEGRPEVDPRFAPHVIYRGDDDEWSLSDRDGWLALRPIESSIRGRANRSVRYTDETYRCILMREVTP
jgi:hypothetical protein